MATKTYAQRNLEAEVRAVEAGHRAVLDEDRKAVRVVSDTHHEKWYVVDANAGIYDGLIRFRCRPEGSMAYRDDHLDTRAGQVPGVVGCMHAALAARRLEREGLAVFGADGLWRTTLPLHVCDFSQGGGRCECGMPEDPWAGLPS